VAPPAYGAPSQRSVQYAGWWQRVGATLLDGLIAIPFLAPALIVLFAGPTEVNFREDGLEGAGFYEEPTGGTFALAGLLYLLGLVVYMIYYCRRVSRKGSSLGMSATGYRIIDARTGGNISMGRSVGRWFARYLSILPCYLGLLWPLWDRENRTFHDMIVQTRAVKT
jgi:uncharacterized RDD family membrane protein YckC